MNRSIIFIVVFCFISLYANASPEPRPLNWAQPMIGSSLENWHKIDERVYRSAQPDAYDFKVLEKFGIRTVINLRYHHSDNDEAQGTDIKLYQYRLDAGKIGYSDLVEIMKTIKKSEGPVLLHCWHGSDRTGAVSAAYRIAFHGWSKTEAVNEMLHGGYGFHEIYDNIPVLIRSLDEEKFRKDIGIR